ncbi:ORF4 [Coconut foliar decay alphasatellite]|uniref:ORF4 n=1 Tax=Coconut foliar decay alphasatellite 1 TaxID=2161874 RepID=Q66010_9VIRU|nr:ORF4 [Coconut foliar decay alphasatellite]AAA42899.1 ORF4 [Coconut foliar decay virus]
MNRVMGGPTIKDSIWIRTNLLLCLQCTQPLSTSPIQVSSLLEKKAASLYLPSICFCAIGRLS